MPQFTLAKLTKATITHANKREEIHGQETVHCKDLAWKVEGPNTLLDLLAESLRPALYRSTDNKDLPGLESTTPELRTEQMKGPFTLRYEGTGYMVTIETGAVTEDKVELVDVEVNNFKVDPKQGGTVVLTFRTQHRDLDREMLGLLDVLVGAEVRVMMIPPKLQDGTMPDDPKAAKKAKDTQTAELPLDNRTAEERYAQDSRPPAAKKPPTKKAAAKKPRSLKARMQQTANRGKKK